MILVAVIRKFQGDLEHFLEICDLTFSGLDSEKTDEDIYSKEIENFQLDDSSDEDITGKESKDIMKISETAVNDHIEKLQQSLPDETVNATKLFIKLIGEQQGEALAVRKYTQKRADERITVSYEQNDIVLLPSHYSYDHLHAAYNSLHPEKLIKNVCDKCILYKCALKESVNDTDENIDTQLIAHISDYQEMRDMYEDDIKKAKTTDPHSLNPWTIRELLPRGFPEEKQVDLWEKIHEYCPTEFQDELCPKPPNNVIKRVKGKETCARGTHIKGKEKE
ncbi:998_t:CDS:2, partial [Racocetra fulgida]